MFVPEEVREDFIFEFFSTFDEDFVISIPAEVIFELFFLSKNESYLKDMVEFDDELRDVAFMLIEFGE